jgi:hypothetical protein
MPGFRPIGRNDAVTALAGIGFLNAIAFPVEKAINEFGIAGAVANTFGISAVVWIAVFVAITLIRREPDRQLRDGEEWILLALTVIFLLPVKYVSWIGLALVALHVMAGATKGSPASRGAWILLAITFPMFWSKLIFSLFSDWLLQGDAVLVSLVMGLPRLGNVITLADGRTHLWIAAGCSSLANVSLAVLGWTVFAQMHRGRAPGLLWGVLCCGLIVALNVGRICLIGTFPAHYDLLHGAVGAGIASWLMVAVVFGTLHHGVRRAA